MYNTHNISEYNDMVRKYSPNELSHHGVKGMKWGVRKRITDMTKNANRVSRAVSAANIEERIANVKRSINKNDNRSDRRTRTYKARNAKYNAKLERLKAARAQRISDLSTSDIDRGRAAYKAIKNTSFSVAVTAASIAAGSVSMPASVATKLVGSGLTAAINSTDIVE